MTTIDNNDIWVFLSHSTKDYDNVRRVRDILENDGFKPIMFFLKCLEKNPDNEELKSLLKREIENRGRFILCKSRHTTPLSGWVEFEVNYIKSRNRYFQIIDIETSDENLRSQLTQFKINSTAYISYSYQDKLFARKLSDYAQSKLALKINDPVNFLTTSSPFMNQIVLKIEKTLENGFYIPIITSQYLANNYCLKETEYACHINPKRVIPLIHKDDVKKMYNYSYLSSFILHNEWIEFDEDNIDDAIEKLAACMNRITR